MSLYKTSFPEIAASQTKIEERIGEPLDGQPATLFGFINKVDASVSTITALDPDIKAGKKALAQALTSKGQPTSETDTLIEMANNVSRIQHESVELDASGMYSKQLFGGDPDNSPLWNLYDVLAQMKNKYLGFYQGLIICEYYKGYDSLQLQGADAYYTCDGDEYDYDALHQWHDADNGRANRWICFLFRSESAEFNIVNTDISPRSMYIGGHIGAIRYFVDGRLTDLVCGVEDSDVVDIFICKKNNYSINTLNLRNVKRVNTDNSADYSTFSGSFLNIILGVEKLYQRGYNSVINSANNCNFVQFPNLKDADLVAGFGLNITSPAVLSFPQLETISNSLNAIFSAGATFKGISVYMPKLTKINGASSSLFYYSVNTTVEDIEVGAMETNLRIGTWLPDIISTPEGKAKINANIRDHIAAKVSDRTGQSALTFTVSTNLYNNLEQATLDAFTAKNWNVAGA